MAHSSAQGHYDYEVLDGLHDISGRLSQANSSFGSIPGLAHHMRTPATGEAARSILPARATDEEWHIANGLAVPAKLETEVELAAALEHRSDIAAGDYASAAAKSGLSLLPKQTAARAASLAEFQAAHTALEGRNRSGIMKQVRSTIQGHKVAASGGPDPSPAVALQPTLLPSTSSVVPAPAQREDDLDVPKAAEDDTDEDSDHEEGGYNGEAAGGNGGGGIGGGGGGVFIGPVYQQRDPRLNSMSTSQRSLYQHRKRLRSNDDADKNYGTAEERTAEAARYSAALSAKRAAKRRR